MTEKTYIFNTREEAEETLVKFNTIATDYGVISVEDTNDICGLTSSHTDKNIGWFKDDINHAHVTRTLMYWSISLPRPVPIDYEQHGVGYKKYFSGKKTTVEPLHITIHVNDLEDPDAILAETFKYIYTITDRMVNLSIM